MEYRISVELDEKANRAINNIVTNVIENTPQNPTPKQVENETIKQVSLSNYLRISDKRSHVLTQNSISMHPYISINRISEDDRPQQIQRATKIALQEYCKREALHEIRSQYY